MAKTIEETNKPVLQLSGEDGNVFYIIGRGRRVLKRAGYSEAKIAEFTAEMSAGDYDHAMQTCFKWFDVE